MEQQITFFSITGIFAILLKSYQIQSAIKPLSFHIQFVAENFIIPEQNTAKPHNQKFSELIVITYPIVKEILETIIRKQNQCFSHLTNAIKVRPSKIK